jgi:hypothetical protein
MRNRPGFNTGMDLRRSGVQTAKHGNNVITSDQLDTMMNKTEQNFFRRNQGGGKRRTYSVDTRNMNLT